MKKMIRNLLMGMISFLPVEKITAQTVHKVIMVVMQ